MVDLEQPDIAQLKANVADAQSALAQAQASVVAARSDTAALDQLTKLRDTESELTVEHGRLANETYSDAFYQDRRQVAYNKMMDAVDARVTAEVQPQVDSLKAQIQVRTAQRSLADAQKALADAQAGAKASTDEALALAKAQLALSSRILRPVERLTAAAERMEKGDLTVRVPVTSEDEIGQLAQAFISMAGSLAQQEQLRRNMVTDVAHELRTPLTNLRGYLEAARDGLLVPDDALVDNLYEETMLLSRLVADLQELAQAEAGQLALQRQSMPLAGIVEKAVTILQPQAHVKSLTLAVALPTDLPPVDVDPERVGQVLRNLLNNAVAHTPQGGEITVAAQAKGGEVAVSVHDTGAGIAPEHLPYVFDRFYRADKARSPDRRRGPGSGDRETACGRPRWFNLRRKYAGTGDHLHFHPAGFTGDLSIYPKIAEGRSPTVPWLGQETGQSEFSDRL